MRFANLASIRRRAETSHCALTCRGDVVCLTPCLTVCSTSPTRPSFGDLAHGSSAAAPLAVRMRPASLDEVVGQAHLLQPGSPLRRLVDGSGMASAILYGPPGSGKTTLASLVSQATGRRFEALSALSAGVKEVRAVIDTARRARRARRADRAVHRRGAPVLQDSAGRIAGRRREPGGVVGGGDHREPVVLRCRAAVVTVVDPATASVDLRRRPRGRTARDRRSAWTGRPGRR